MTSPPAATGGHRVLVQVRSGAWVSNCSHGNNACMHGLLACKPPSPLQARMSARTSGEVPVVGLQAPGQLILELLAALVLQATREGLAQCFALQPGEARVLLAGGTAHAQLLLLLLKAAPPSGLLGPARHPT